MPSASVCMCGGQLMPSASVGGGSACPLWLSAVLPLMGTVPGCDRMNENFITNKMQGSGTEERVCLVRKSQSPSYFRNIGCHE